jgi:hydrogenase large subunit
MYAKGEAATTSLVNSALAKLGLTTANLYSTLGRVLARTVETKVIADWMPGWYAQLTANIKAGDFDTFNEINWNPATWPAYPTSGVGYTEAPRGGLGHWVTIEAGRIKSYQIVVPSTWNASPRDEAEQPGAYEAALVGHKLADPDEPLEILRTIHSFDPCIGCAVHLVGPDGQEMLEIKVQ